jgi:hypothetical protein
MKNESKSEKDRNHVKALVTDGRTLLNADINEY